MQEETEELKEKDDVPTKRTRVQSDAVEEETGQERMEADVNDETMVTKRWRRRANM